MKDAEQLRQLLSQKFLARSQHDLGDSELLQRLATARQALSPPRGRHALPSIAQGVLAFRVQRRNTPYPYLKYACYGLARPTDWDNRLLLDDAELTTELLAAVTALEKRNGKAFTACCRALQQTWEKDIAGNDERLCAKARENTAQIATFIAKLAQESKD